MNIKVIGFLILSTLWLAGCEPRKKEVKVEAPAEEEVVDKATIAPQFKLPPLPELTEEDKAYDKDYVDIVDFPDPEPLEREHVVTELRVARHNRQLQYIFKHKKKQPIPKDPAVKWHMHDEDYQQHGPHPVDVSTYPTDLSRMILETQRITGVLEDEVNSQIAGRAVVVVNKAVPSADFTRVLIPAGSKMVCNYKPLEKIGDTRLDFNCTRMVRPDGLSVFFLTGSSDSGDGNAMIGADQKGRAGLIGDVDTRAFERYGSAFLVSAISGLSQMGYNKDQSLLTQNNSNLQQFSHQFGNNLAQITAKLLEESIDLRPSITIKGGSVVQLRPVVDIYFRKPVPVEEITK